MVVLKNMRIFADNLILSSCGNMLPWIRKNEFVRWHEEINGWKERIT